MDFRTNASLLTVLAILILASTPASANFCAYDAVPAASLLFPFVAIDYNEGSQSGINTVISITNLSHQAHLTKVTIWTDYGFPMLSFNVALTGYDVQTIDIRDILVQGQLPVTKTEPHSSTEGATPDGPVSPHGTSPAGWIDGLLPAPEPTNVLERCDTTSRGYPGLYATPIPPSFLDLFKAFLSVSQSADRMYSDSCTQPYDVEADPPGSYEWFIQRDVTGPTWMYITVDLVETCDNLRPTDPGYWGPTSEEEAIVASDNVLTGDVYWLSTAGAAAGKAVHLEADRNFSRVVSATSEGTPISFYHSLTTLNDLPSDMREPLPTAWALRYAELSGYPDYNNSARIRVWKGSTSLEQPPDLEVYPDPEQADELRASNCYGYTYYAWDEDEMVVSVWGGCWGDHPPSRNLFPLRTQEVSVEQLRLAGYRGWLLFVWPSSNYPEGVASAPEYYQTWMGVAEDPWGTHATFADGTVMANWNCFSDQELPNLGVNYDYVKRFAAEPFPRDDIRQPAETQ